MSKKVLFLFTGLLMTPLLIVSHLIPWSPPQKGQKVSQNTPCPRYSENVQTEPPVQTKQQSTQQHQDPRPRLSQETQRSLQTPRPQIPRQSESPQPPKQSPAAIPKDPGLNSEEQRMMGLVNAVRAKNGFSPLSANIRLSKVARLKASDMIKNNYFNHNSPTYGNPFDMMKQFGISYRYAGENLAGATTVEIAHNNLMNSSGHRANILNAGYKEIGIGVVNGGPYGKMFVQMFTD